MDTKSIKSKYDIRFKIIAWVLCLFSMCFIAFSGVRLAKYDSSNTITSDKYVESMEYLTTMTDYVESVNKAYFGYGEDAMATELNSYISTLRSSYESELGNILGSSELEGEYYEEYMAKFKEEFAAQIDGSEESAAATSKETVAGADQSKSDSLSVTAGESGVAFAESGASADGLPALDEYTQRQVNSVNQKYAKLLSDAPDYIKNEYKEKQQQAQDNLAENKNYYFAVVENGKVTHTNVEKNDAVAWIGDLDSNKQFSWNGVQPGLFQDLPQDDGYQRTTTGSEAYLLSGGATPIYVGMSNDFFKQSMADYAQTYRAYLITVIFMVVCIVIFAGAFIWLLYTAGRSPRNDDVKVGFMDSIYLDIGGIGLLLIEFLLAALFTSERVWTPGTWSAVQAVRIAIYISIGTALLILWSMSVSRRVKRKENYTLVGRIFTGFRDAYDRSDVKSKGVGFTVWYLVGGLGVVGLTVLFGLLMGGTGIFIGLVFLAIYLAAALKYILQKAAAIREIAKGISCIKEGTLSYTIPKGGGKELDEIASGIEHIAEGFEAAVTHEVKSEKMKTELITNVSHDIKTPLTSILTYVDLLKKEGLTSENAPRYLEVLDMKSKRLKFLTDDLFEAAKASSGDMTVDMARMELVQFMEQALGEMSDKIEGSGLEFVVEAPQKEMFVEADGKLLWRVIGNVLDNVIKYAAAGTRVYIDFVQTDETNCVVVKNVSRDPLNMTEDELMERFKRGDESRHTEGSGLGLSIAKNFMQMMNGEFRIEIDGDLFKVRICFPKEQMPEMPAETG